MIQFKKKFYFFQLKESWYRLNDSIFKNLGLVSYFCVQNPPSKTPKSLCVAFSSTLSINLKQETDEIVLDIKFMRVKPAGLGEQVRARITGEVEIKIFQAYKACFSQENRKGRLCFEQKQKI
jgi:hypothetical protein